MPIRTFAKSVHFFTKPSASLRRLLHQSIGNDWLSSRTPIRGLSIRRRRSAPKHLAARRFSWPKSLACAAISLESGRLTLRVI
jgi:hypothetical protein